MTVYAVLAACRFAVFCLVLVFIVPLATHAIWWQWRAGRAETWATADWSSAGLLPAADAVPDAMVRVYSARVGRWRGIFAHHTWIVIKESAAARYTRFDVVGWGQPVRTDAYAPDGRWFGNDPEIALALDGAEAMRAIPHIRQAVSDYPHRSAGSYRAWPGPNSNTFAAHVVSRIPGIDVALLPTALGKDWAPPGRWLETTPGGTGIRLTWRGYLGLTLGWVDGIELNLLGAVAGIDLRRPALKLPGWGRLPLRPEDGRIASRDRLLPERNTGSISPVERPTAGQPIPSTRPG